MEQAAPQSRPARKRIRSKEDLDVFVASQAYEDLLGFICTLNEAVLGKKNNAEVPASPNIGAILDLINKLREEIAKFPPAQTPSRFGNPSFRQWHARMEEIVSTSTPFVPAEYAVEINTYIVHSFGHRDRIDYGTGHELNFAVWLYCLLKTGAVEASDAAALVLRVFRSYLALMRQLQMTYWLEPAGSHGIWGLDDYQFLPFLWGSAQLCDHPIFRPKSILNKEVVEDFAKDYMYFDCIRYINMIKTETLQWHSPMLNDIAGVKTWRKVNEGMIKMYQGEVLRKLPIMQHFLFGTLVPISLPHDDQLAPGEDEATTLNHYHDPNSRCCYHRVPSAFSTVDGAAAVAAAAAAASAVVPFD